MSFGGVILLCSFLFCLSMVVLTIIKSRKGN